VSDREIFNEAFGKYGVAAEVPADVPQSSYTPLYDPSRFVPDIYCDYIETDKINAIATVHNGRELVGIFSGLANYIVPHFALLLADHKMFPQIGSPEKESDELFSMRISFMKQFPTLGFSPLNKCPIRSQAIRRLNSCAQFFIHAHEVAHIVLGHLDLLREHFSVGLYEEIPAMPLSEEEGDVRKALELQADQSAALTTLHLFRANFENDHLAKDNEFSDKDLLWTIAVDMLYLIFEKLTANKGHRKVSLTHPSPVCTGNLNTSIMVMKSTQDGV
jgi:hypothetical protein